jgi:hypothetical protein
MRVTLPIFPSLYVGGKIKVREAGVLKMIRGRYGLVIVGIVVAMLSVAAGAGFYMVFVPLPDPATATRHDLLRWLVLRDLDKESPEIRQKIVSRLDTEFETVGDLGSSIAKLEESRRKMLWHNFTVLLQPWLAGKVEEYSRLPSAQRIGYLDHFLDRADEWNKIATACQSGNSGQAGHSSQKEKSSLTRLVMDQIQQSSEHAEPDQRQKITEFTAAVQARWLWRQLPSFNFFGQQTLTKPAVSANIPSGD